MFGAQAFPFRAATPGIDFSEFPICRTASNAAPLTGAPRKLKLSWNAGAVCLAPLPVAIDQGIFQKHNLDVELVNYSGSTDQLLEAIATGKSDAGLGMALRWLKPLEQGFDVKIAAGTHGGCMRVLSRAIRASTSSPISKARSSASETSAVRTRTSSRSSSSSRASTQQGRRLAGLSRQSAAARGRKGRSQAFLASDPIAYLWLKDSAYKEVASNLDGEYKDTTCCIIGLRGSLMRDEPQVARALTQAVLDAAMFTSQNPDKAAASFQPYAPKTASLQDLQAMVRITPTITIRQASSSSAS